MRNTKGITLIALVITIIVLLILAGVSLSLIMGNEGLLGRATSAVDKNREATAKEQVELLIADFQTEFYEKKYVSASYDGTSREYVLEKLKDGASAGDYYVQTDDEAEEGLLNVYEGSDGAGELVISGSLQENGKVEWEEKVKGISVRYRLNPSGYTNGNVTLTIKASSSNGSISEIQGPITKNEDETYTVTENGDYEFTITDSSGASRTKMVKIQKIDRVAPPEFTPTITDVTEKGFTIEANAVDHESGIERYEYYVGGEKYESTEGSYVIDTLNVGTTYEVYVIAYDKAKNFKVSSKITQETQKGTQKIYIDSVRGNDETGIGTQKKPYATLDKIGDEGIIQKGCVYNIMLGDGIYELTTKIFELNCDESVHIFGNKQNTTLNVGKIYGSSTPGGYKNYKINFYRLIWNDVSDIRTNVVHVNASLGIYNVYFNVKESNEYAYFSSQSPINLNNCTLPIQTTSFLRKNDTGIQLTNCYGGFSSGYYTQNEDWDYQTNYVTETPQVDSTTYRITDNESVWKNVGTGTNPDGTQANLGVYGGEYSWEE